MRYNTKTLLPYIPTSEYETIATEFLESYYPEALVQPQAIPILDIARSKMGLDVQFVCLSEETDIYGMTIFDDGIVDIYDPNEGLYESKVFKKRTILIDSEAVKRTNVGCMNNTIAHECLHWYKHRLYYKMQKIISLKYAKICKCCASELLVMSDDEEIIENQANGIAPKILMPKKSFEEYVRRYNITSEDKNLREISEIAKFFDVSKQSAKIRLEECGII